tara:strand:- start:397 stop:594 length:198 start_codon:yes stop_codon:yes gene_type:complete
MNEKIEDSIKNLTDNYTHFSTDVENFLSKGNKSAATRARKSLLEISKLCKDIRKQIQDIKNSNEA